MHKFKKYDDDNGMTVADMNVEGTPWYNKDRSQKSKSDPNQQLTRYEARRYNFYALLAGLLVASIFSGVWILLTLFMTKVWFK